MPQVVKHCANNAKIMDSIPGDDTKKCTHLYTVCHCGLKTSANKQLDTIKYRLLLYS